MEKARKDRRPVLYHSIRNYVTSSVPGFASAGRILITPLDFVFGPPSNLDPNINLGYGYNKFILIQYIGTFS